MNYKALALGVLSGFLIALAPSCSAEPTCGPANCSGCCTAEGTCTEVAAQNNATCGASGNACGACAANQNCVGGTCQTASTNTDAGMTPTDAGTTCTTGCAAVVGGNTICIAGTNSTNCGANGAACTACSGGQTCVALPGGGGGQCQSPPDAGSQAFGQACTGDADCAAVGAGTTCLTETADGGRSYEGGYCTTPCTSNAACGADGVCLNLQPLEEDRQACWDRCTPGSMTDGCRAPDYMCWSLNSARTEGLCWLKPPKGPPPPDDLIGSACTATMDCRTGGYEWGFCQPETLTDGGLTGWTDGYCVGDCSIHQDVCGTTAECLNFGEGDFFCIDRCAEPDVGQSDCRPDYVCDGLNVPLEDGGTTVEGYCFPSCNAPGAGCPPNRTCSDAGYCM